jgi:hypothetical protein
MGKGDENDAGRKSVESLQEVASKRMKIMYKIFLIKFILATLQSNYF